MKKEKRDYIIQRHRHSIWMYGPVAKALYWENKEVQELRFDVLLECGIQSGDSVLDVGCGFADLYHYMKAKGLDVDYTGIDLSPDMIKSAKARSPDLNLEVGDLFDFDPAEKSFDWVLLSGALNEPLEDNAEYVKSMLPRLYASCRKGLAFNLLNDDYSWQEKDLYTLQPYKPAEIMQQLEKLSAFTHLRKDYLAVDASYFVWRDEKNIP